MNQAALTHLFQEDLYHFTSPLLVVLSKPWDEYQPDDHVLLKKILTSVKIDLNAVQVVSVSFLTLASLRSFSPARVLIFGSETTEQIGSYQHTSAQGFTVIRADDLTQLDEGKKKNLWIALRQMFGPPNPQRGN